MEKSHNTDNRQKSYTDKVAEKIIASLEDGTAPWIRPWSGAELSAIMPVNPITNKPYKGINFVNLSMEQMALGSSDPRWLTYKQAASIGAQVRQGEKGTTIQYWKFTEEIEKTDENGKTIYGEDGKPEKVTVQLENPKAFYSTVFNATQIDGMPELVRDTRPEKTFEAIEAAERILANSGATIRHVEGGRAFYRPQADDITLPMKYQFNSQMGYYSTALHELGHWTGHPSRLDRDLSHSFGTQGYAKEELRAEIASYMLCSKLGVDFDPSNHHAYIKSWVSDLRDKPTEIFKAAADAGKITQMLQGFNMELEQTQAQNQTLTDDQEKEIDTQLKAPPKVFNEKTFLAVPYKEKDIAKRNGAMWDKDAKLWYAPAGAEIDKLSQFIPENAEAQALTKTPSVVDQKDILAQFKQALENRGLIIDGDPIMDSGKLIRVPVQGDKLGDRSGAYMGYTDGRPAGIIQNWRAGTKDKWVANGEWQSVSPEEEAAQRAKMAQNKADRERERLEGHNEVSVKVRTEFKEARDGTDEHPYLVEKGIKNHGLKLDARGNLLMPLSDVDGKMWTAQHIGINGYKGFEPGGKKEGNFYLIGATSIDNVATAVICEGYATGASIYEATNQPVIVAVDAGNLANVVNVIHEKFPEKPIVIAADDDIQKEQAGKDNVGRLKAEAAAEAVKGIFIAPRFTPDEIGKGSTDFNDLAKSRGLEEVKKQLDIALDQVRSKDQDKAKDLSQGQTQTMQRELRRQVMRQTSFNM